MTQPATRPTAASLLREAARAATAGVNVCLPCSVVSYSSGDQTCTVKLVPCFRRRDPSQGGTIVCYDPPEIPGVPVAFPGAGNYSITWPLAAGDTGMLLIADRSMDEWKSEGTDRTEPEDARRHDLLDGVFIPGTRPPVAPVPAAGIEAAAIVIRASDGTIKVASAEIEIIAASVVAKSALGLAQTVVTSDVLPDHSSSLTELVGLFAGLGLPAATSTTFAANLLLKYATSALTAS